MEVEEGGIVIMIVAEHAGEVDRGGGDEDAMGEAVVFYLEEIGRMPLVKVEGLEARGKCGVWSHQCAV
jgi:hypothetical protein